MLICVHVRMQINLHLTGNSQFITAEWFCNRCISALNRKKIPSTSRWNRMSTASVPQELQDLNTMEERLIARVAPYSLQPWKLESLGNHPHGIERSRA